jgi:hypothetical protein
MTNAEILWLCKTIADLYESNPAFHSYFFARIEKRDFHDMTVCQFADLVDYHSAKFNARENTKLN